MASDAIATMGLTFKKGAVAIVNLTDISRSGTGGGMMDTTNLSSANGKKTYETNGVYEEGEISISFNYDPSSTSHTALVADWQGATSAVTYTITFTGGDAFVGKMIPVSVDFTNTLGDDGKLEGTAVLKLDGTGITDPS